MKMTIDDFRNPNKWTPVQSKSVQFNIYRMVDFKNKHVYVTKMNVKEIKLEDFVKFLSNPYSFQHGELELVDANQLSKFEDGSVF